MTQIQFFNQALIWIELERDRERGPSTGTPRNLSSLHRESNKSSISFCDSMTDVSHILRFWGPCNPEILPCAPSSSLRKLYSISFRSYIHRLSVGFQPPPHKLRPSHTLSHFCQITLEAVTLCTLDSCVSHSLNDLAEVSLFKLVCSEISMQVWLGEMRRKC